MMKNAMKNTNTTEAIKRDLMINEIQKLTEYEALQMAEEILTIKDHTVIFANLGETFGYSVLVFMAGKHIYFANDYELHHKYMIEKENGKEQLRQWYIDTLNRKLYTNTELLEEVKTYDDYRRKEHFLRNYYIQRYDYISIFGMNGETKERILNGKDFYKYYNPVSFCYVADKSIVETQMQILEHLTYSFQELKGKMETFREMVSAELANHEACITCSWTDALDALGMKFEKLTTEQQSIVKEELKKQMDRYC